MISDLHIAQHRVHNQRIEGDKPETAGDVVRHLTAMQAQDYLASLWAIGLRMPHATESMIEQAIAERAIVRAWPMRGTLHVVAPEDVRWMLRLMTPRVIAQSAGRYRQLELDEGVFHRSKGLLIAALEGGKVLTRNELYAVLEDAGIQTASQRGIHILSHLTQKGLLCLGPWRDKQPTFTLLDEWLPDTSTLPDDEALATIALRYFTAHGPATVQDFARWTGLTLTDARAGLNDAKGALVEETSGDEIYWRSASAPVPANAPDGGRVHLLPAFDEYIVGYKERGAVLHPEHEKRVIPGKNGMFNPVILIDGCVAGTWKRKLKKSEVVISYTPFRPFSTPELHALDAAARRYGDFLAKTPVLQDAAAG